MGSGYGPHPPMMMDGMMHPHMSFPHGGVPMHGPPLVSPHMTEEHSAFLQDIGRDQLPGHPADDSLGSSFIFGAKPAAAAAASASTHSFEPSSAAPAPDSHPTAFLFGDGVGPNVTHEDKAHAANVVQSGLGHLDLSGLQTLKKAVLVTGGMCSKMFGIAIVGFLAFQSMQANMREQEKRDREQALQYGYR